MNNDIAKNLSVHSNSKGNLLKTAYISDNVLHFAKSGRLQVRDYPENWGIESLIEVICYKLGRALGLNIAKQSLDILSGIRLNKAFTTLICDSPDFRNGKTLVYLQSLYVENEDNIDFGKLCRNTGCGEDLINMLAFDLIIMNEDRHNSNIGFLVQDNGTLELAPIYDNGYSLLYDDIPGILCDFKAASKHCLCNAPLYQESFKAAEKLFMEYSKIYYPTINLDVEQNKIKEAVYRVKSDYELLLWQTKNQKEMLNNIPIDPAWWDKVIDFIMWRIEYVRDLRDNVAE